MPTGMPDIQGFRKQSGAAILVILLLIVVSAATLLLDRLSSAIKSSVYNPQTSIRLEEAKTALISWAVNHPINPGTLPMPDRNGDSDYDGDSDCYNGGTIGNNLLLGRLPWRGYPSPCKDSASLSGLQMPPGVASDIGQDRSGQVLWYAVAHNLVYETPEYPFISPAIKNKPDGWITVRDKNGKIISDRVAFVVIAPGPALAPYTDCEGSSYSGQSRSTTAPDISNYLDSVKLGSTTYNNADYDQDFIMYPNSIVTNEDTTLDKCDQFNDQLEFVTIDELMEAVSKRVLNETANALSAWHNANGKLPWLARFADPKSDPRPLTGEATSASNNLVDTSVDFTDLGVAVGDVVWNLTDGSRATVSAIAATTLTLGSLRFGTTNTFAVNDEYLVERYQLATALRGDASNGSDDFLLEDAGRDFAGLGIQPGDVIDNLDDGSSGVIASVNADEITVVSLSGGSGNDFRNNDDYQIRSNQGRATSGSSGLLLEDTNVDFNVMGVQVGDIVRNLSTGASGPVTAINTANKLTVDSLLFGTAATFTSGNYYAISRFSPNAGTRSGLLPLHRPGQIFPTGFTIDWNLAGGTLTFTPTSGLEGTYTSSTLSNYAWSSSSYSGTITVNQSDASCQWLGSTLVRCKGLYEDVNFLSGIASTGTTATKLVDTTKNFSSSGLGIKRGDLILDQSNNAGIVSSLTGTATVNAVNITSTPSLNLSSGNTYRIKTATAVRAGNGSSPNSPYNSGTRTFSITVPSASSIQIGDTIENTHAIYGGGIGKITNVSGNLLTVSELIGGPVQDIYPGENFAIHYNFVDKRQYQFDITLKGNSVESTSSGVPTRTICAGYNSTCTTVSNNATFKGDGTTTSDTAWVTIRDYEGSTQVGQVTNKLSTGGITFRSLKLGSLQYSMDADSGDIPEWFVRNKWYQYVMVAYDDGDAPGGTVCTPGTDCITVNMRNATNNIISARDSVRAVVMLANDELTGQAWSNATVSDYYDNSENTDADELFDRFGESATFNDLIRVAVSCPSDATKLCWSN